MTDSMTSDEPEPIPGFSTKVDAQSIDRRLPDGEILVEVFAVHVDALDPDLLHESNDHAADFYPDDLRCWTYDGDVSPHALLNVRVDISGVAA